jgi:hypothetical protein
VILFWERRRKTSRHVIIFEAFQFLEGIHKALYSHSGSKACRGCALTTSESESSMRILHFGSSLHHFAGPVEDLSWNAISKPSRLLIILQPFQLLEGTHESLHSLSGS